MNTNSLRPLPPHFRLRDIVAITAPMFEFKTNPHMEQVAQSLNSEWLMKYVHLYALFSILAT